jgi:hypothetical protein
VSPQPGRQRSSNPRQHLWDEAVLHLARLGRQHLWRTTVGVDWIELRDEATWIKLQFLPEDQFVVMVGAEGSDEPTQQWNTESYARALEIVENLASRG